MRSCSAQLAGPSHAGPRRRSDARGALRPTSSFRPAAGRAGRRALRVACKDAPEKFSNETKLRSEAQAPFRVARQFIYGALGASAAIGGGIALIQLARASPRPPTDRASPPSSLPPLHLRPASTPAARAQQQSPLAVNPHRHHPFPRAQVTGALGAPSAPPLSQSGPNFAVDLGVLALMAFLYKREEDARTLQMSRISREERLGNLRVRKGNQSLGIGVVRRGRQRRHRRCLDHSPLCVFLAFPPWGQRAKRQAPSPLPDPALSPRAPISIALRWSSPTGSS